MIEFGQIGDFDRVCSPRAVLALTWRPSGGLAYLSVRLPWFSRRGFLIPESREVVPRGWCWRFACLRIRRRWPTFNALGWLEPRER